jgi:hypothetical protein
VSTCSAPTASNRPSIRSATSAPRTRAARRNGLSEDEIKEVLLQTAVYCGVPAANTGFAVAARVLDEKEES